MVTGPTRTRELAMVVRTASAEYRCGCPRSATTCSEATLQSASNY